MSTDNRDLLLELGEGLTKKIVILPFFWGLWNGDKFQCVSASWTKNPEGVNKGTIVWTSLRFPRLYCVYVGTKNQDSPDLLLGIITLEPAINYHRNKETRRIDKGPVRCLERRQYLVQVSLTSYKNQSIFSVTFGQSLFCLVLLLSLYDPLLLPTGLDYLVYLTRTSLSDSEYHT